MSETIHYNLHLTDDSSERFIDWREAMNGPNDSNMTKIDTALWDKYEKPSEGIPETDLASAVQTKLNEKEVKWAEYGVTTPSTIYNWVSQGYVVKCNRKLTSSGKTEYRIYDLADATNLTNKRSALFSNEHGLISVSVIGGTPVWQAEDNASERTDHKVTSLSTSSNNAQYPSAKCVYDALEEKQSAIGTLETAVDGINGKIPSSASSTNKLVSASEMGDAIEAVEAKQLYATSAQGSFATKAALTAATTFYNADGTVATPTKNDVAYVLADESHSEKSAKYVIANEPSATVAPVWGFVITFSDTTFTQTQMDAINSGITSTKRSGYDSHVDNDDIHVTVEQKSAWSAKYDKPTTGIPESDLTSAVQTKLNEKEVKWAEYGVTTLNQLYQWFSDGNLVLVKYSDIDIPETILRLKAAREVLVGVAGSATFVGTRENTASGNQWAYILEVSVLLGSYGDETWTMQNMRLATANDVAKAIGAAIGGAY